MKTFGGLVVAAIYAVFCVQTVPAPWAIIPEIVAIIGSLAGLVQTIIEEETKIKFKRDFFEESSFEAPAVAGRSADVTKMIRRQNHNMPQPAYDQCREELRGATVTVSRTGPRSILFEAVPPTCMTLTNVIVDNADPNHQAVPIPMGSDSVEYRNLADGDYNVLMNALRARPEANQ